MMFSSHSDPITNVGLRLSLVAQQMPDAIAVAAMRKPRGGNRKYDTITFRELDDRSNAIAAGLIERGAKPGMRLALLVKPGIDFITLVYAMFKAGVVTVLIDPGMGRKNLIQCLEDARVEGFVAISLAQAVRVFMRRRFPLAKLNVTVGRRWFWGGATLKQLLHAKPNASRAIYTKAGDPAAIIFTSGSTGPPKGVLYLHGNFDRQVDEIRNQYDIRSGEIDVGGFPLFALFNGAMGVTTVVPSMDFSRPASVDPRVFAGAIADWQATQSFGSPAIWNAVGRWCEETGEKLPSLKRVLSAGAPVPVHVLKRVKQAIAAGGEMHTPYGATESLPVATISASEVLNETAALTACGAGTCVGKKFPGIEWRAIAIEDGPIEWIAQTRELPPGEIGELIVSGPVVTREYATRVEWNGLSKIVEFAGEGRQKIWHRIGDVGYLDAQGRFWFCGRKSQRVITAAGTLFTEQCEPVANSHPHIYRSALVGVRGDAGNETVEMRTPVLVIEPWPEYFPKSDEAQAKLLADVQSLLAANPRTSTIRRVLLHPSLPVDIRHNAKIFREQVAVWAESQLSAGAFSD